MTNVNNIGTFDSLTALWAAHPEGGVEGDYAQVGPHFFGWSAASRNWVLTTPEGDELTPDQVDLSVLEGHPNYLGSFANLTDVWHFLPNGGEEGAFIKVAEQAFKWDTTSSNWIECSAGALLAAIIYTTAHPEESRTVINYLGAFETQDAVWYRYPEGGYEGDYVHIDDVIKVWNKFGREWGDNVDPSTRAITNETVEGDLTVLHNLTVAGIIRCPQIIASEANSALLWAGHAWEDYMNQPVRTTDVVTFAKVIANALQSPDFSAGIDLGTGWEIGEHGHAEFESLVIRRFLEVPELRYNRTSVEIGNKWNAPGGGIIESVHIDLDENGDELMTGVITLHLEDGESGMIAVDDICQGVFHDGIDPLNNSTDDYDSSKGEFRFKGFFTTYFRVTEILDSRSRQFRYALRPVTVDWEERKHPRAQMHFVAYGNFTDTTRQKSRYATRTYERFLTNVNDWQVTQDMIAAQFGDLSNLSVHGLEMEGYSAYLRNIYMSGTIKQFEDMPLRLEFDTEGDNFLAFGESLILTCKVFKGFDDVTANIGEWSITRDSGDPVEDAAWRLKGKVQAFTGTIQICFNEIENDLGDAISTLFTVRATMFDEQEEEQEAVGNLVI